MWVSCLNSAEQDVLRVHFDPHRYDLDCVFSVCVTFRVSLVTEPWKLNTNPFLLMQYNVYKVQFLYLTTRGQQHAEREESGRLADCFLLTLKKQTEGYFLIKWEYQLNQPSLRSRSASLEFISCTNQTYDIFNAPTSAVPHYWCAAQ